MPVGLQGLESSRAESPRPVISRAELVEAEVVAGLSLEQDGNRGEQLEDVEQLLVRGVVRQEVAQVHLAQRRHRPGERGAPAAANADVELGVLRLLALAVELVVQVGHRAAQLPEARNRRVVLVARSDLHLGHARRRARAAARSPAGPGPGCTSQGDRSDSRSRPASAITKMTPVKGTERNPGMVTRVPPGH